MRLLSSVLLPLSGPVLQAWLAAVLIRKGVVKDFRFFFIYTVFTVVAATTKFLVHGNPVTYFHAFVVTEPLYAVLGYLAIGEVFHRVFKSFYPVIWWFKFLLPGMGLLMLGVSALIAVLRPPIQASEFLATVFVFEIIVNCVQLGVFFLIFGLAAYYDLFWRQYSFGITAGFGVAAFGILGTIIARSIIGTRYAAQLQFVPPVTYFFAVLIWLISFLKPLPPDPLGKIRPLLTPELMNELAERYKRLTKDIFRLCWEAS